MGLAVVKGIVARYGGSIHLNSTPGKGTRFAVMLPVTTAVMVANPVQVTQACGEEVAGMTGTVMLVEDEEGLRVATAKMLRKTGLAVIEASDGWEALELLRDHEREIDLILLDMNIPGASSRKVFTTAQRNRPEIKILLTTAYGRAQSVAIFDGPHVKGFIRKPYQFADLAQLLGKALGG
jgi:CheY-like chemotaxis protein